MDKETARQMYDFVKELQVLNKEVEFRTLSRLQFDELAGKKFFASIDVYSLNLPEGFHINAFGKITNRKEGDLFDDNYVEYEFGEISKIKHEVKTNNIDDVNTELYTAEELAMLEGLNNQEKETEVKAPAQNFVPAFGLFDEAVQEEKKEEEEEVVENKRGKRNFVRRAFNYVVKGLFARIAYKFAKRAKVKNDEELGLELSNNDEIVVTSIFSKIQDDKYIIGKLREKYGDSAEESFKNNPKEFINTLKKFAMVKEFHDFAMKDPLYNEAKFEEIMRGINNLSENHTSRANRLLQEARYGNIAEGQMQFLENRLEYYKNNPVDKEQKIEQMNNAAPEQYGSAGGPAPTVVTQTPAQSAPSQSAPVQGRRVVNTNVPKSQTVSTPAKKSTSNVSGKTVDTILRGKWVSLYNELGEYEKSFINDALAEGLTYGDQEFNMMLSERTVNKASIENFYKTLNGYKDRITESEISFIEDAVAEGLDPNDNEFRMMLSERPVNKDVVENYFRGLGTKINDKVEAKKENEGLTNEEVHKKLEEIKKNAEEMIKAAKKRTDEGAPALLDETNWDLVGGGMSK